MAAGSDPRLEQARRLISNNQPKEARALLVPILKDDPKNTEALFLYARVARNDEEAEKVLKRLLDLEPLNSQARTQLNRIQQRGVENLADQDVGVLLGETSPTPPWLLYAVMGLLAVLIIGGGIAVALYFASEDDNAAPTPLAQSPSATSHEIEVVIQNTRRVVTRAPEIELAGLPTWTPEATDTPRPTRTQLPTFTTEPSRTPRPTITPSPPAVAEIERFDLPTLGSLYYNEYVVLAAQVGWAEDAVTLENIGQALSALADSIRMSNYEDEPTEVAFLVGEFLTLIDQEQALVQTRLSAIEQGQEADLTEIMEERLVQQSEVERRLSALIMAATATQEFQDRVDMLRTPSLTPIVLPTLPPG